MAMKMNRYLAPPTTKLTLKPNKLLDSSFGSAARPPALIASACPFTIDTTRLTVVSEWHWTRLTTHCSVCVIGVQCIWWSFIMRTIAIRGMPRQRLYTATWRAGDGTSKHFHAHISRCSLTSHQSVDFSGDLRVFACRAGRTKQQQTLN